jgi:hypothetical protein
MTFSYKQENKNKIREEVIKNAINYLTDSRESSAVVTTDYMEKMWGECLNLFSPHFSKFNIKLDEEYKKQWLNLQRSKVGKKKASELKVVYLCGPEPTNDLKVLLKYGVSRENIWAVETGKKEYASALKELRETFPFIKIFKGKLETFLEVTPDVFDIIYFDSCSTIPNKQFKTHEIIYKIFYNQKLSDIGILITNFSEPNTEPKVMDRYLDIMSAYYFANKLPSIDEENKEYTTESFCSGDFITLEEVRERINKDYLFYYQSFITRFIYDIATFYAPYSRAFSNPSYAGLFFKPDVVNNKKFSKNLKNIIGENDYDIPNSTKLHNISDYPHQYFFENLKCIDKNNDYDWLKKFFSDNQSLLCSIEDSIKIVDYLLLGLSNIDSRNSLKTAFNILRTEVLEGISSNNFFDKNLYYTCDIPFSHLLTQLLIYQLGYPYHLNLERVKRYTYKAKDTTMFTDVLVFDKCRYLYEWIPTIDLFAEGIKKIELQIIARICINRFNKVLNIAFSDIFHGGNIFCYDEENQLGYSTVDMPPRYVINKKSSKSNKLSNKEIAEKIITEIEEKVGAYLNNNASFISSQNPLPLGNAYLTKLDRRKGVVKELINLSEKHADIYSFSDNNLFVRVQAHQSLEINKKKCEIVKSILNKYDIECEIKEYIN